MPNEQCSDRVSTLRQHQQTINQALRQVLLILDAGTADSPLTRAASTGSYSVVPPMGPPPSPRTTRKSTDSRRKDEICRLRVQAAELEAQAVFLRYLASMNSSVLPSLAPISHDIVGLHDKRVIAATMWRNLAQRRKLLRDKSDKENVQLRRLVEKQRKTIASIRRLLQRQMAQYVSVFEAYHDASFCCKCL